MKTSMYETSHQGTRHERSLYRDAAVGWLSEFDFDLSVTLTFNRDVSVAFARKKLELFNFRLSQKVYGRKAVSAGRRVVMAAFLEEQGYGRLHWHLLIERACVTTTFRGAPKEYVKQCWRLCAGNGKQIDVQEVFDVEGVIHYDSKEMKRDPDTLHVDWLENSYK